jgi:hypothetical protein
MKSMFAKLSCVTAFVALALGLLPSPAAAQDPKPRILIVFDTSGSMAFDIGGTTTHGDGSNDPWTSTRTCCPGNNDPNNRSRLWIAKEAMTQMLNAAGEIEFGLVKFAQTYYSDQDDAQDAGWYQGNQSAYSTTKDKIRYKGRSGTTAFNDPKYWLAVGFGAQSLVDPFPRDVGAENDRAEVLSWFDHHEYSHTNLRQPADSPYPGPYGDFKEQELRADGSTPLGESIREAYNYLMATNGVIANDPFGYCRKYTVLVLTDGEYDGSVNPVGPVTDLYNAGIDSWVIGLAIDSPTLDAMAAAGGGHFDPANPGRAFIANSQEALVTALFYIISESLQFEVCNYLDDNCNGRIDEGVIGPYCDIHNVLGTQNMAAPYANPNFPLVCEDPGETRCDGQDDNCDGQIDELPLSGTWKTYHPEIGTACVPPDVLAQYPHLDPNNMKGSCQAGVWQCVPGGPGLQCVNFVGPSPEVCDGKDNDCDGIIDNAPGSSAPYSLLGEPCGVDIPPVCTEGIQRCVAAFTWECEGGSFGGPEICDGIDNNCDGQIDETFPEAGKPCYTGQTGCTENGDTFTCIGTCRAGIWSCENGGLVCVGEQGPTAEVCDGLDNDCDGTVDNHLVETNVGAPCPNDVVAAAQNCAANPDKCPCRAGIWQCEGTAGMQCVGTVVRPVPEVCDGIDNNCDGQIDENLFGPCGNNPNGDPNEGECRAGTAACNPVTSTPGNPVYDIGCTAQGPTPEVCDGKDNDCDGLIDNADPDMVPVDGICYPQGLPGCTKNHDGTYNCVGECSVGNYSCVDGRVTCVGYQGPVSEGDVCDGLDNNCNGLIDEGISRECPPEIDYTQYPNAQPGVGACHFGTQQCVDGAFGPCIGAGKPGPELCNGIDDDCDGWYEGDELDDLLANPDSFVGQSCGACADMLYECNPDYSVVTPGDLPLTADWPGAYHLECVGTAATPEICDGLDNDCNGVIDDGIPPEVCGGCLDPSCAAPDAGECETGLSYCIIGVWSDCYGSVGPEPEVCDGKDNDCNGLVDDGLELVGQVCQEAIGACSEGIWQCWTDLETFETGMRCCDRSILESEHDCVPPTIPTLEICDGLDNNCNGEIDEDIPGVGIPCGLAIGECSPGITQCLQRDDGTWSVDCVGGTMPTEEICDGLDNDCDGLVDNLPPRGECSNAPGWMTDPELRAKYPDGIGICTLGQEVCIDGEWQCNAPHPELEICDGLDNDCDGLIDENLDVECPIEGSTCIEGMCAQPCMPGEYNCPGGQECVQLPEADYQWRCISSLCDPSATEALPCVFNEYYCSPGYTPPCHCDALSKSCVDKCFGKKCPEGTQCVVKDLGRCHNIDKGCTVTGCDIGQVCVDKGTDCDEPPCQVCVADPCDGKECSDGQYCNAAGKCVGTCADVVCPRGTGCRDGKCVDEPCAGRVCDVGVLCNPKTGRCDPSLPNPCHGMSCDFFEVCDDGECVFNSCWNILCPPGTICRDGSCYAPGQTSNLDTDDEWDSDDAVDPDDDWDSDDDAHTNIDRDTGPADYKGLTDVLVTGAGGCLCSGAPGAPESGGGAAMGLFALGLLSLLLLRRRVSLHVVLAFAALLALGCQVEPYSFDSGAADTSGLQATDTDQDGLGDTDSLDTASDRGGDTDIDTVTPLCTYGEAGECAADESCCLVGPERAICVSLDKNPKHCGACNNVCHYPNAAASCQDGACQMGACESFFHDVDADPENGCEYFCQPTVSPEANADFCDGIDNDCDGLIDEDVDFDNDPLHCGVCHNACRFNHAQGHCEEGKCVMGACDPNWYDINNDPSDGCEYFCLGSPDAEEICNFQDDNCDGLIDNEVDGIPLPGTGEPCYPAGTLGCEKVGDEYICKGICQAGVTVCSPTSGTIVCSGYVLPAPEVCNESSNACCDGLDNNCNGIVDEGGAIPCGGNPNGDPNEGECRQGLAMCKSDEARPGAPVYDTDNCIGDVKPAPEICDGKDNDCDGQIDELHDSDGYSLSENDKRIGLSCGVGECAANVQYCDAGTIKCTEVYKPVAEIPCNEKDDNCNGIVDEITSYACGGSSGVTCNDTDNGCDPFSEGMCQAGTFTCDGTVLVCQGDVKPACADTDHCDICDGIDNDCDGVVDEDAFYGMTEEDRRCGEPCMDGRLECIKGVMVCVGATEPTPDICDGIDNDCNPNTPDGSGDPLYMQPCDGDDADQCKEGVFVCAEISPGVYGMVCNETGPGRVEVCDGVDNDCDGIIDNNLTPPSLAELGCSPCPGGVEVVCAGAEGWKCSYNAAEVECVDTPVNGRCFVHRNTETQCDGKDGDCDGVADDDFQLETNVYNCGGCGNNCNDLGLLNVAEYYCLNGVCQIKSCDAGFFNANRDIQDGCECQIHPDCLTNPDSCDTCEGAKFGVDDNCNGLIDEHRSPEICDGKDNNCDGQIDEGLSNPGFCQPLCSTAFYDEAACINGAWTCNYQCGPGQLECSPHVDHPTTGAPDPTIPETRCDGIDGNCDGTVDEPWRTGATSIGSACSNESTGAIGGCLRYGVYRCSADGTGTVCCDTTLQPTGDVCLAANVIDITSATQFQKPEESIPNGIDDNCNGVADEGAQGLIDAVRIPYTRGGKSLSFDIFAYEASRADATDTTQGTIKTAACSQPGVLPWTSINFAEARAACQRLNDGDDCETNGDGCWDLCTTQQWEWACAEASSPNQPYPYGDTYAPLTCNGLDFSRSAGQIEDLVSTGDMSACVAPWTAQSVMDLSGNAKEWTQTSRTIGTGSVLYDIRGGSYKDLRGGMTCQFDFVAADGSFADYRLENLGFRCCRMDQSCSNHNQCLDGFFCNTGTGFCEEANTRTNCTAPGQSCANYHRCAGSLQGCTFCATDTFCGQHCTSCDGLCLNGGTYSECCDIGTTNQCTGNPSALGDRCVDAVVIGRTNAKNTFSRMYTFNDSSITNDSNDCASSGRRDLHFKIFLLPGETVTASATRSSSSQRLTMRATAPGTGCENNACSSELDCDNPTNGRNVVTAAVTAARVGWHTFKIDNRNTTYANFTLTVNLTCNDGDCGCP